MDDELERIVTKQPWTILRLLSQYLCETIEEDYENMAGQEVSVLRLKPRVSRIIRMNTNLSPTMSGDSLFSRGLCDCVRLKYSTQLQFPSVFLRVWNLISHSESSTRNI
jgi:hypothetical protein